MIEFKLPDLGEGIHEGELLKWHVAVGDDIKEDDPLVEVETDKAAVTIPSPFSGKITTMNGNVGDIVNVGDVIVVFDDGTGAPAVPVERVAEKAEIEIPATQPVEVKPRISRPIPAAPATRRLAREMNIDINLVPPTGPAGRVTPDDIRHLVRRQTAEIEEPPIIGTDIEDPRAVARIAAHAATVIPFLDIDPLPDFSLEGPIEKEPLRSIRRRVAHKMTTSKTLIPHVSHMDEVDVTLLEEFRKKENTRREGQHAGKLTLLPFVVLAITAGLKDAPVFNASLDPFSEEIIYKKYYNIGIAVDSGRGLIVPVIKNTDRISVLEIAKQIEDLAERAHTNKLQVSDLLGGTFTITNIGPLGGTGMMPAINYPEVAILGMGRAQDKPVVRDGQIVIRKMLPLTLAFDHRIADGADAARFVGELVRQLSDPNILLIEA